MGKKDQERFKDYPVFKGLQKPLEFLGLKGRYIFWAAGAVGGGLLGFLIGYILLGFLAGLLLLTTFLGVGGSMIFLKQHQGLHSKKAPKGILIFARSKSY